MLLWINSTVYPVFVSSIVYSSNVKKVWDEFKERFDISILTRIYHLWTEIGFLIQGTSSIATYYAKMKDPWDELDI